jgi:hypothetical protein
LYRKIVPDFDHSHSIEPDCSIKHPIYRIGCFMVPPGGWGGAGGESRDDHP